MQLNDIRLFCELLTNSIVCFRDRLLFFQITIQDNDMFETFIANPRGSILSKYLYLEFHGNIIIVLVSSNCHIVILLEFFMFAML